MSVAIRAITRLQDGDDAPSLGAGQDGYALTWDNASGAFVATALSAGVTDHGALTGLSDDDHSQYLLATGARTGASSQAQAFALGITSAGIVTLYNASPIGGPYQLQIYNTNTAGQSRITFRDEANALNHAAIQWFNSAVSTTALRNSLGISTGGNYAIRFLTNDTSRLFVGGTGLVGIGTDAPGTLIHGLLTSSVTNAVTNVVTIGHDTTGTAAAGFGAGLLFQLESSTTAAQSAARIQALWNDATHATRKADLVGTAYDAGGEREGWRVRGNGSAAAIGFLGAAPIARIAHVADPAGGATVDAEARSAINSILATLEGFGFHATS